MGLVQTLKDIKRLNQIVDVLLKAELGYLVERLKLKSPLSFGRKKQELEDKKLQARLRMAMEELGGTFIKLGQLLSLRPDLIPEEYCREFSKLQDNVHEFGYEEARKIVEEELKKPLHKTFKKFEKKPIAAASVGQVYLAVLKTGEKVAVKVQRPGIGGVFKTDIDILYHIAKLAEKHMPELKEYNVSSIVEEFERYTKRELDYTAEAENIDVFYNNFRNDKKIKIPKVYWEYTTKKVLTMEYIEGKKIGCEAGKEKRKKVVKTMTDCFIKQVLEHGFFHADPHPGNIFLMRGNKVALLDFGIVGRIGLDTRKKVEYVLMAVVNRDANLLARSIIELGIADRETDVDQLEKDLTERLGRYYNLTLEQTNISSLFYEAFSLARKYKMKFPANFVLLIKAMATVEGFDKKYYPEFNLVKACKPTVNRIMKKRTSPKYLLEVAKKTAWELKGIVTEMPSRIARLMDLMEREEKKKLELEELEIRSFKNHKRDSTTVLAIIIGALIVASAIMAASKMFIGAATGLSISLIMTIALLTMKRKEVKV